MTRQLNLQLLTPGATVECHAGELIVLCDELARLGPATRPQNCQNSQRGLLDGACLRRRG
jgi:hypothetical protein